MNYLLIHFSTLIFLLIQSDFVESYFEKTCLLSILNPTYFSALYLYINPVSKKQIKDTIILLMLYTEVFEVFIRVYKPACVPHADRVDPENILNIAIEKGKAEKTTILMFSKTTLLSPSFATYCHHSLSV